MYHSMFDKAQWHFFSLEMFIYTCITPTRKDLHWLPCQEKINYKIIVTAYKYIHRLSSIYPDNQNTRQLTSSKTGVPKLLVNQYKQAFGKKWNESGFRPPLCTYRLNWARRTSWGWWDDWDDTVLQTQDSKFEPWRSEAEHATSRSRRLPTILTFTRGWGRNNFVSFKPP